MQSVCKQLSTKEGQQGKKIDICGLHGGSASLFTARLQETQQQTMCCLVPSDDQLESLAGDIRLFTDIPVLTYPANAVSPVINHPFHLIWNLNIGRQANL
ncbi:MAG: hypothetical protein D3916_18575 [Candidatus Electrothrix sp. MAN1_4]|nr:hypothetical protein [Candidatus Electrothrix sp. MAN1_4]